MSNRQRWWRVSYWLLFVAFFAAAALNMAGVAAGFATNYLADVVVPAWLYIVFRSLDNPARAGMLNRLVGRTPERAAATLFLASAVTEISQLYWPQGLFAGTFDPLDIAACAAGILPCYVFDRLSQRAARRAVTSSGVPAA